MKSMHKVLCHVVVCRKSILIQASVPTPDAALRGDGFLLPRAAPGHHQLQHTALRRHHTGHLHGVAV